MHWLPLVAMVLASALPSPHSLSPRIITAVAQPASSSDNHRSNSSNNYGHLNSSMSKSLDSRPKSHVFSGEKSGDYSSYTNWSLKKFGRLNSVSKKDYNVTVSSYMGKHNSSRTHKDVKLQNNPNKTEHSISSFLNQVIYNSHGEKTQESSVKVSQRQKNLKGSNVLKNKIPRRADVKGGGIAAGNNEDYKGNLIQEAHLSLSNHILEDYKSLDGPAQDDTQEQGYFFSTGTRESGATMNVSPPEGFSAPKGDQTLLDASTSLDLHGGPEKLPETETALNEVEGIIEGRKLVGEEELMFLDAHPRVLFSSSPSPPSHPPVLLMLEAGLLSDDMEQDDVQDQGGVYPESSPTASVSNPHMHPNVQAEKVSQAKARLKRSRLPSPRSREMPMCEVESGWVTDKKTAIDSYGKNVTVLPVIQTLTGPLQQYFYETRCKLAESVDPGRAGATGGSERAGGAGKTGGRSGVSGGSCIGVDKRQWVSECKVKQSFVRALTIDVNKRVGWRWIRINSSCVCVLLSRVTRN